MYSGRFSAFHNLAPHSRGTGLSQKIGQRRAYQKAEPGMYSKCLREATTELDANAKPERLKFTFVQLSSYILNPVLLEVEKSLSVWQHKPKGHQNGFCGLNYMYNMRSSQT